MIGKSVIELLNPWNFLDDRSFLYLHDVTLCGLLDRGWLPGKARHDQKLGNFSPASYSLERGEGLEVNSQSYLCDETSIKIPKVQSLVIFRVGNHFHMMGRATFQFNKDRTHELRTLPALLCIFLSVFFNIFFIINWHKQLNCFLGFCKPVQQILQLRESWAPLIYS